MPRALAYLCGGILKGVAIVLFGTPISLADGILPGDRRSGFEDMSAEIQAMQRSDTANPGMLWVSEGKNLWLQPAGSEGKSCASCHADAEASMRGVAVRYPAFEAVSGIAIDLDGRIRQCRTERQKAPEWRAESRPLLAMSAYLGSLSRGMPIAAISDPRLQPATRQGETLFKTRMGQLDLACSQCHDHAWGRKLGASTIPQGHSNGYPIYRLEWQGVGSLQRRIRNCMTGVRAEPFSYGVNELIALELYLRERAAGLAIETPAVRP
jgi:L-cysteine S-thiosulfotransferase